MNVKEYEIINLLWFEERPLSANEIVDLLPNKTWKDSTIHAILNGLLDKGALAVDGVTPSGRTYSRLFTPTFTMEEYLAMQIQAAPSYERDKKGKLTGIVAALLDDADIDSDTLIKLEALVESRRRELER